ncbi:MAG: rhomboid family intramembrane serine protease [Desulfobacterales bacterium]|nr:rhomboid family intramembrane serine protease [Desulfobacterales bacterium]
MIPIRDNYPTRTLPVGTWLIIVITFLVFLFQWQAGFNNELIFYLFGLVPGKYTLSELSRHFTLLNLVVSPFTYMFFHGGFWHFVGNMWFLYIFGDNVESHLGTFRFLAFYILSGLASGLLHFMFNPLSPTPTIGASGAVAGVMGAYFLLYPRAKILTVIPILIFPWFIDIPAFIFLGIWFVLQFINATGAGMGSGIAWWAHIGGFIAGMVLIHMNRKLPGTGASQRLYRFTQRKKTPKLQVISTLPRPNTLDLHGDIEISSLEALTGARKRVTVTHGLYRPLYRVVIPAGIRQGTRLRLNGLGRALPGGQKGDLYLRVMIKNVI